MIKTLRLENFKPFEDTGDIELKPITVLAGPNSGGKTSILQSLLLLRQTLESGSPEVELNLDGKFLQFSGLDDLTFGKPPLQECRVTYKIGLETTIPGRFIPSYYPGAELPADAESSPLQSYVELSFWYREVEVGKGEVVLGRFEMNSSLQDVPGPRLTIVYRDEGYQVQLEGIDLPEPYQGRRITGIAGTYFIPAVLILEPDSAAETTRPSIVELDSIFRSPLASLQTELKDNLRYLGPLREEPQRAYLHSGSPSPRIGKRGEYAAQMLWLDRNEKVHYKPGLREDLVEATLLHAVGQAFRALGITQPIGVWSQESVVYQILFGLEGRDAEKRVTIADVGFGVSQLLPIVVMGLRSPDASLLLFEQPEIHLHPQIQANLADFFLGLAMSGRRLLIETHSDHFINRLRRRIAEDPTDELRDKVSILFVQPPRHGRGATIEPLKVDRYGNIENWPPDFLPEAADEAEMIVRAGLRKRQGD